MCAVIGSSSLKSYSFQSGSSIAGLAIENDGNTNTWDWEILTSYLYLSFNGTNVGYWSDATGAYVATSDKRLKKDINVVSEPVLDRLLKLQVVDYRLLHADNNSQKTIGFIAQDVEPLFPSLVQHGENGYLGLNYDDFGVIAIKAIQEQQKIIDGQNEKIKQLEEKIEKLLNEKK